MMEEGNVTILVDAKQEYTKQLINVLKNNIYNDIQSIYKEASRECSKNKEPKKKLITFQSKLSQIPKWQKEKTELIFKTISEETKCDWIDDLLTAVFITHTKILTIVHKGVQNKKINLKIPKSDHFIHLCYIECAREFWKNPYLFSKKVSQFDYQRNMRDASSIICDCITETIRKQLPVKHILKEYLGDTYQSDVEDDEDLISQPNSAKHNRDVKNMVKKQLSENNANLNINNENSAEISQSTTEAFVDNNESQPQPITEELVEEVVLQPVKEEEKVVELQHQTVKEVDLTEIEQTKAIIQENPIIEELPNNTVNTNVEPKNEEELVFEEEPNTNTNNDNTDNTDNTEKTIVLEDVPNSMLPTEEELINDDNAIENNSDNESEIGSDDESEIGSDDDSEVGSDNESEVDSDDESEVGSDDESDTGSVLSNIDDIEDISNMEIDLEDLDLDDIDLDNSSVNLDDLKQESSNVNKNNDDLSFYDE